MLLIQLASSCCEGKLPAEHTFAVRARRRQLEKTLAVRSPKSQACFFSEFLCKHGAAQHIFTEWDCLKKVEWETKWVAGEKNTGSHNLPFINSHK